MRDKVREIDSKKFIEAVWLKYRNQPGVPYHGKPEWRFEYLEDGTHRPSAACLERTRYDAPPEGIRHLFWLNIPGRDNKVEFISKKRARG